MKTKEQILEAIKNNPSFSYNPNIENASTGFTNKEDAVEYVRKEKKSWGSNLVGWVKKENDRYYPCFNIYD